MGGGGGGGSFMISLRNAIVVLSLNHFWRNAMISHSNLTKWTNIPKHYNLRSKIHDQHYRKQRLALSMTKEGCLYHILTPNILCLPMHQLRSNSNIVISFRNAKVVLSLNPFWRNAMISHSNLTKWTDIPKQ